MTQFNDAKHQNAMLSATQTSLGMERVATEASKTTRRDLDDTGQELVGAKDIMEALLLKLAQLKLERTGCKKALKHAVDTVAAFGKAENSEPVLAVVDRRTSQNDVALAELLQNELAAMKGALPQALCHYLSAKSDACRAAEAAFLKGTEAAAKADGA